MRLCQVLKKEAVRGDDRVEVFCYVLDCMSAAIVSKDSSPDNFTVDILVGGAKQVFCLLTEYFLTSVCLSGLQ